MKKGKHMPPADKTPPGNGSKHEAETKKIHKLKLLKNTEASLNRMLIFGILFGLVGGYTLYKGFAATPSTEGVGGPTQTRMIMRFKPSATKAQRDAAIRDNNVQIIKEIPQIGVKVLNVPNVALNAVTAALKHNPAVDFVEQDEVLKLQEQLPDDPYYPTNFALDGGAWGWTSNSHTSEAWDITQGDPRIVTAILDTGIKPAGLTDFDGQISSTWNVMNNSTDATTNAGVHGTYVAGVAGLAANNSVGNAGYCPKCKLMIVQVGTDTGVTTSDLIAGITYAADHGAKVINMSLGGATASTAEQSAEKYAHDKGVILFAAAGNSNCDCKTYPSADPYVHGVAGYTSGGTYLKQGDSNYGTWVHYAAPEPNMTAWPSLNGQPGYGSVGGTSVASPAAAAMAALVWSANPSLSASQVEQALQSSTIPVGFTIAYGALNPLAALKSLGFSDPQPSSTPVQVVPPKIYYSVNGKTSIAPLQSAPQVGQTLVRGIGGWTGSVPLSVTGLQWQRCDSNGGNCKAYNCSGSTCTLISQSETYTVQTADVGSTLKLVFSVKNGLGSTPASVLTGVVGGTGSTPVPTVSISASPTSITAGQSSTLSWSSTNATSCTASGAWSGSQSVSGSASVSPVSNSTYTLTCTGSGGSTSASATILVAPAAVSPATPTGLAPTPLSAAVTLTWNANTEADLAGYDLQYKPSTASSWTLVSGITAINYTLSGLVNGTSYDFQLRAKNTSAQVSAWTATVSATPQSSTPADTTPPVPVINAPINGTNISGAKKINISASATDDNVVIKMEVYIDGALKTTVTTPTVNYSWSINKTVKAGSHTITVKAYDAANNVGSASVTVTK